MKKIMLICGARPNFMKIAPIKSAIEKHNKKSKKKRIKPILVHTGQHYDYEMSRIFFKDLELPKPDIFLNVKSGLHGEQTAKVMTGFEKVLIKEKPDLIVVVGDVNSTLAASLTAVKLHIPVAHVEAGFRSFDRKMPEEINRILTDISSDFLFTTCREADANLKREGVPKKKIFRVGDIMIDTLLANRKKINSIKKYKDFGLEKQSYAVLTLHRPSNVDCKNSLRNILKALEKISLQTPILFPAHPRTLKQIKKFGFNKYFPSAAKKSSKKIRLIKPLGYIEFNSLLKNSKFVLTDSGSIQEEAKVLNVPCITLRDTTERMETIHKGTNVLVGNNPGKIVRESLKIIRGKRKKTRNLSSWDGRTSERIIKILVKNLYN